MCLPLCAVLAFAQLTFAADFVKKLTPKDLMTKLPPILKMVEEPGKCAIPPKVIRVENSDRLDPIAGPRSRIRVDKGITHPVPISVCQSR